MNYDLRKQFNTAEKFAEQVIDDSLDNDMHINKAIDDKIPDLLSMTKELGHHLRFITDDVIETLTQSPISQAGEQQ